MYSKSAFVTLPLTNSTLLIKPVVSPASSTAACKVSPDTGVPFTLAVILMTTSSNPLMAASKFATALSTSSCVAFSLSLTFSAASKASSSLDHVSSV